MAEKSFQTLLELDPKLLPVHICQRHLFVSNHPVAKWMEQRTVQHVGKCWRLAVLKKKKELNRIYRIISDFT